MSNKNAGREWRESRRGGAADLGRNLIESWTPWSPGDSMPASTFEDGDWKVAVLVTGGKSIDPGWFKRNLPSPLPTEDDS